MSDLEIDKVAVTPEYIDDFRLQFGQKAPNAFAADLVGTFQQDFATQIADDPNFLTLQSMQDGTAGLFDKLSPNYTLPVLDPSGVETQVPIRDLSPQQRKAFFSTDDAVSAFFSNAEPGSLLRSGLGEFLKTAPSVTAGTQAAKSLAARTFRRPPKSFPSLALKATPPAAAFIAGSLLLYEGGDALEELVMGPDQVILPSHKYAHEMIRTFGGGAAGIQVPFLMNKVTNSAARNLLKNLAEDAPRPAALRFTATLEKMIEDMGGLAKGSKTGAGLTVAAEGISVGGSSVGAGYAEDVYPGQTGPRLGFELLGGSTLASTFGRLLPKAVAGVRSSGEESDKFLKKMMAGKQEKLFTRIKELYIKNEGNYEAMMADLDNPETNAVLKEIFPDVDFTAAQRLDDNTGIIMQLEAKMAGETPDLAAARQVAHRQATSFFEKWIDGLNSDGSPEALRTAAILRKGMFTDMLQRRLTNAVDNRVAARNRLLTGDAGKSKPEAQRVFSAQLADTMETQLDLARRQEKKLWNDVGGFTVFEPKDIINTDFTPAFILKYDEVFNDLLPRYQQRFIDSAPELYQTVQDMKRRLGIDIREGILEQNNIISAIDDQDSGPSSVIKTQIELNIGELPLQDQINRMSDLISDIKGGNFKGNPRFNLRDPETGEGDMEPLTFAIKGAEQENYLKVATAKKRLLELEKASLDPTRVEGVDASELVKLRTEVRNDAVNLYSGATTRMGTANQARKFGEIAEAILDDLNSVADGANKAYDIARAYSFSLNEVWTRSIAGKARAKTAMGANRIPVELLTQQFVRSNPDVSDLRIQELQGIAEFAQEQGFDGAEGTFLTLNNIMEGAVRAARLKAMAADGTVNARALEDFNRDNADLLDRFPNLKSDLNDAVSAQRTFEHYQNRAVNGKKLSDGQSYLASLIGNTSPTMAISEALNFRPKKTSQPDAVGGLRRLFRLTSVKFKGPDGKLLPNAERVAMRQKVNEGFSNAILQHAAMKSGVEGKTYDAITFHKTLFSPLPGQGAGKQTLMDLAESYGIMDKPQIRRIRAISNQMVKLAAAEAAGNLDDPELIKQSGPIFDFYLGMVGLAGGTKVYQGLTGGTGGTASISAAGFGKSFILDLFKNAPASKRAELQALLFTDPKIAAALIDTPKTAKDAARQRGKIQALLEDSGFKIVGANVPYSIREAGEDEDIGTGRTTPIPTPQGMSVSSVAPTAMPAPQPVPAQRVAPPTSTLASVSPPPPAASGPIDRDRYKALFPNDGIASLFG